METNIKSYRKMIPNRDPFWRVQKLKRRWQRERKQLRRTWQSMMLMDILLMRIAPNGDN